MHAEKWLIRLFAAIDTPRPPLENKRKCIAEVFQRGDSTECFLHPQT